MIPGSSLLRLWIVLSLLLLFPTFKLIGEGLYRLHDKTPELRAARESYERGEEAFENGDYDLAIVHFDEAIRLDKLLVTASQYSGPTNTGRLVRGEYDPDWHIA